MSDLLAIPVWIILGLLLWIFFSVKVFGSKNWFSCIALLLLVAPQAARAQNLPVANMQFCCSGSWVNPLLTATYLDELWVPRGVSMAHTAITATAAMTAQINVPLVEFGDASTGGTYYIGYEDVYPGGTASSLSHQRIGVMLRAVLDESAIPAVTRTKCYINTDGGTWKELFEQSFIASLTAYKFATDQPNGAHATWAPEFCSTDVSYVTTMASIGIQFTGVVLRGGATTTTTAPTTTESGVYPDPAVYATTPTTVPSATQPTTQQWVTDLHNKIFREEGSDTVVGQVKSQVDTWLSSGDNANKTGLRVFDAQTLPSTWGAAAEDFMLFGDSIFPNWRTTWQTTDDALGAGIFDSRPGETATKWAFRAWDETMTGGGRFPWFATLLPWFRAPIEFGLCLATFFYGIYRLAWALGMRNPEDMIPPLVDDSYMHVEELDALGNALAEYDHPKGDPFPPQHAGGGGSYKVSRSRVHRG